MICVRTSDVLYNMCTWCTYIVKSRTPAHVHSSHTHTYLHMHTIQSTCLQTHGFFSSHHTHSYDTPTNAIHGTLCIYTPPPHTHQAHIHKGTQTRTHNHSTHTSSTRSRHTHTIHTHTLTYMASSVRVEPPHWMSCSHVCVRHLLWLGGLAGAACSDAHIGTRRHTG